MPAWPPRRLGGLWSTSGSIFPPPHEGPRSESGLDNTTAAALVAYGARAWSDWWASEAIDWVDQGVWDGTVAQAPRDCSQGQPVTPRARDTGPGSTSSPAAAEAANPGNGMTGRPGDCHNRTC